MRIMKRCRRVKCCYILLDKLLLWEIRVQKKRSSIGDKADCHKVLDDESSDGIKEEKKVVNDVSCLFQILFWPGVTRKWKVAYVQSKGMKIFKDVPCQCLFMIRRPWILLLILKLLNTVVLGLK
ncbi:unnamed protein product [Arabis nemorensis]|uniref:Uncharacterized protein n=1 Tax=Arabis nemorensis TaxID=586526 RepID=A0A565CNP4_9BRAS|nr:unnamed protein product [Arabis nemorensis]